MSSCQPKLRSPFSLHQSIYKPAQSVNRQRVKKPNLSILAFSHKGQNLAVAAGSIGRQIRQAQLVKTNPTPSDFWYTHRQAIWLRHVDPGGASRVKGRSTDWHV